MSICCSARADMIYGSAVFLDGNLDILDATGRDNGINVETQRRARVICAKRRRVLFHEDYYWPLSFAVLDLLNLISSTMYERDRR